MDFNPGDYVRCIMAKKVEYLGVRIGQVFKVYRITGGGYVQFKKGGYQFSQERFVKVNHLTPLDRAVYDID